MREDESSKATGQQRVRGVGTAKGQGEVIIHEVWLSISVPGRRLEDGART